MEENVLGIHHVTAITGDAQRNLDFYTGLLGLRLVKVTVNFDDPGSYHFYYGDGLGRPGTILTYFAWPGAPRGRQGTGQVASIALAIPQSSLGYWIERLVGRGIAHEGPVTRFNDKVLTLKDPDGLPLELVAASGADPRPSWDGGFVPLEHSIRGVHTVTAWEDGTNATVHLLSRPLGFRKVGQDGSTTRYALGAGESGALFDVRDAQGFWAGRVAAGTVHHVAWRTASDDEQLAWRKRLLEVGSVVTPVQDRQYFHSIYFREPGGVLFEIATDPPGFTADEPADRLGTTLKLPPWLEPQRAMIEHVRPPVRLPGVGAAS
jgi:catechol 2,3-dioxygenase-like lactoylglutathione lyase family enzyme